MIVLILENKGSLEFGNRFLNKCECILAFRLLM